MSAKEKVVIAATVAGLIGGASWYVQLRTTAEIDDQRQWQQVQDVSLVNHS